MLKKVLVFFIFVLLILITISFIISKNVISSKSKQYRNFGLIKSVSKNWYSYSLAVTDINNNGKNELIYKDNKIHILEFPVIKNSQREICNVETGTSADNIEKIKIITDDQNNKKYILTPGKNISTDNNYTLKKIDANCQIINEVILDKKIDNINYFWNSTYELFYEDIDNDNLKEIIAAGEKMIVIIKQDETVQYLYKIFDEYPIGYVRNYQLVDINNDNVKEFLASGTDKIIIFDQNQNLLFNFSNDDISNRINAVVGDLDNNGKPQLFIIKTDANNNNVKLYIYNTLKNPDVKKLRTNLDWSDNYDIFLQIKDFDNDGQNEIIIDNQIFDNKFNHLFKLPHAYKYYFSDLDQDKIDEIIALVKTNQSLKSPDTIIIMDNQGKIIKRIKLESAITGLITEDIFNDKKSELIISQDFKKPIVVYGFKN